MKNITEVAVFDLGRPFSTSSQLSVDEPDAQATAYGREIIKRKAPLHAEHPIPLVYNPLFKEYHDQRIPANGAVFINALIDLTAKRGSYRGRYDALKTDPALTNTEIYSTLRVQDVFGVAPGAPQSIFKDPIAFTPAEARESILTKNLNFYQVMMGDVVKEINRNANRPHIALFKLFDELGYHLLTILKDVAKELRDTLQLIISLKEHGLDAGRLADLKLLYGKQLPKQSGFRFVYQYLRHIRQMIGLVEPNKEARFLVENVLNAVRGGDTSGLTPDFFMELLVLAYPSTSNVQLPKTETDNLLAQTAVPVPSNTFAIIKKQIQEDIDLQMNHQSPWKAIHPMRVNTYGQASVDFNAFGTDILAVISEVESLPGPNIPNVINSLLSISGNLQTGYIAHQEYLYRVRNELINRFITLYMEFKTIHDPSMGNLPARTRAAFPFARPEYLNDLDAGLAAGRGPADYSIQGYFRVQLKALFELARLPTDQQNQQGLRGLGLNFSTERIDHVIDQLSGERCSLQNTLMIRSPTGTGKTKQYMLLIAGLRRDQSSQFRDRTHTVVFTSNSSLAAQAFAEFCTDLNETVSLVCETIRKVPGKPAIPLLDITTKSPAIAAAIKQEVDLSLLGPCNIHTRNGLQHAFQVPEPGYPGSAESYSKRLSARYGGIVIAPLYLYDLLYTAGVLDDSHPLQTVVFDEVDVFYNIKTIPDFHQFFFTRPSIFRAQNVIFCSATITPEFIQKYDQQLVQSADRLMWTRFTGNTGIQDSANTSVQSHMNSSMVEPITSIDNTVGRYIYLGYWDFVDIRDDEYTLYRQYGTFKKNDEPNAAIKRILQYNKRAITSNYPIHAFKLKDVCRLPFTFVEPIADFIPLVQVYSRSVAPDAAGIDDFASNTVLNRLLSVTYKNSCKQIRDGDVIDYGMGPVTVNDGFLPGDIEVIRNNLADSYHTSPNVYRDLAIQLSKALVLHVSHDESFKVLVTQIDKHIHDHFNNVQVAKVEGVFGDQDSQQVQQIPEGTVSSNQPFYSSLIRQLRLGSSEPNKNLLVGSADFFLGGRGLDIPALVDVYIILPMYQNLDQMQITLAAVKQAVGRVGRAQRVGHAHIVQFMHQPGLSSVQFPGFCAGITIASVKASYEQIGFDGYRDNCDLVDKFMAELKRMYRQAP